MTELGGFDREVTSQGKATGVRHWYGVYCPLFRSAALVTSCQ